MLEKNIFIGGCFTGWGSLLFFDTEEHQIPTDKGFKSLVDIPKLGPQWKIIHEFKPTDHLELQTAIALTAGKPAHSGVFLIFGPLNIYLCGFFGDDPAHTILKSTQLPKIGEWSRIEMSHEEVDGKYFLSLSVGGREVARAEADPSLKRLTDVNVKVGFLEEVPMPNQPGFVRRLVILEKR